MKSIRTAIAALVVMIASTLAVVTLATPAEAATRGVCRDAFNKTACVTVAWTSTNTITAVTHSTPNGCSSLGSPRYIYKDISTSNRYYHLPSLDCGSTFYMSDGCGGCSTRTITVWLKMNVPWDYDYEIRYTFTLRKDGSSAVDTFVDVGACC